MKSFKDQDILNEEEAIDKQINDANVTTMKKEKDLTVLNSNLKVSNSSDD